MLDLYRLHIFVTAAREGSFNRAGQRLGMSASGVSQHMQKLEAELGQKLFKRSPRGVTLTEAGQILHAHSVRLLEMSSETKSSLALKDDTPSSEVTIGATPGVSVYLMPEWIQSFRRNHPNTTVHLQTGTTSQVVASLLKGECDVVFVEGDVDELNSKYGKLVLDHVEQFVVVGPHHAWWGRTSVRIDDLNGQSFIVRQPRSHTRQWLEQTLLQHGVRPVISAEFDNPESIKRAVANGVCLTVLPYYAVQQEVGLGLLHAIPLEGQPLMRRLLLLWPLEHRLPRHARSFVFHLADRYPSIGRLPKLL